LARWVCLGYDHLYDPPGQPTANPFHFFSSSPAISFPLLVIMPLVSFLLARSYLKEAEDKPMEGLKFGVTMFLANIVLDFLVIVGSSLITWAGYWAYGY
jgi:hypothetical protein